jgi:hypothetical protein
LDLIITYSVVGAVGGTSQNPREKDKESRKVICQSNRKKITIGKKQSFEKKVVGPATSQFYV